MINLSTALRDASIMTDEEFGRTYQVGKFGQINGLATRDCPAGMILLRHPKSNEKDIRVTITAEFMSKWKPAAWSNAGLKSKKVSLLLDPSTGFALFKPVPPDAVGLGIYRLEQNKEGGQARLMTTCRYLGRRLKGMVQSVPFEIQNDLAMADLRDLIDLNEPAPVEL